MTTRRARIHRLADPVDVRAELAEDARRGLGAGPKALPPKYFYDAAGSELFEEITELPEYYLTRAELEILEREADALVAAVGAEELVELGSGSSRKTRLLLDALGRLGGGGRYVPLDVSEDALRGAVEVLTEDYPWLEIEGLIGDFGRDLRLIPGHGRRLFAFLGSSIGNFEPAERRRFLREMAVTLRVGDALLLGLDLVKEPATLEAAYNDARGVTAAFNRNVLHVLNRELDGDLPADAFEHVARYEPERSCVEMRLRASRPVRAHLGAIDMEVRFEGGEELRTEISTKFTREGIAGELADARLALERWSLDGGGRFALALAVPGEAGKHTG